MAYIGKTPSQATRSRFYYTATGGETSLSGADDNGNTLVFSDGNYVDVMLNGVTLVAGTDYNTTTANTIGGLTALTASDIVEIVVYDTFSVFGGDVKGNFNVQNGTLTAEGITGSGDMAIDTDTLFVDVSQDRVGINTASPAQSLDVASGNAQVRTGGIFFSDNIRNYTGGSTDLDIRTGGAQDIVFATNNSEAARFNTSGNLAFINGKGIDFSASESGGASSSLLDDYEEGTWTATWTTTGTPPTTPPTATGFYIKTGRLVTASVRIGPGNLSGATGTMRVTGLPFTVDNATTSNPQGSVTFYGISFIANTVQCVPWASGNQSYVTFFLTIDNGAWAGAAVTAGNSKYMELTVTYSTA